MSPPLVVLFVAGAISAGLTDARLDVMAGLVTMWGARLTFNFARKGGHAGVGTGAEDYRWVVLRARMSPLQFQLFNLFFIVIFQNPVLVLTVLFLVFLVFLVGEWTVTGIVLLLAVFIGSTVFTEAISRSKYPEYLAFQRSTSAVIPWFPRQVTNSATV
jgi:steroid 5-alpha reductase family enzyme